MKHDGDHERVKRWLLSLAERQVTASGSRATFTSDMYFEAAESIEQLGAEIAKLKAEMEEARELIGAFLQLVTHDDEGGVMMELLVPTYAVKSARAFLDRTGE